ncbi:MAG: hypothetical protein ACFCUX_04880, partial [Candidatus Methylacidiphilales bacterium]
KSVVGLVCIVQMLAPQAEADLSAPSPTVVEIPASAVHAEVSGPKLPVTNPSEVMSHFSEAYVAAEEPRLLIYVNRRLLAPRGEMLPVSETRSSLQTKGDSVPLSNPSLQIGSGNQSGASATESSGMGGERLETSTERVRTDLDRALGVDSMSEAEARAVEESFQKSFLQVRAKLVDQRVAELSQRSAVLVADRFLTPLPSDAESQELASLKASTDVVVELLVRQHTTTIPKPSGQDETKRRMALTATAVRLSDGRLLAQIDSDTLFGFNQRYGERQANRFAQVTSAEIIEQTALALMERLRF